MSEFDGKSDSDKIIELLDKIVALLENKATPQDSRPKKKCLACAGNGMYEGIDRPGVGHCYHCGGTGYDK